jgi:uncharacterized repeat protein (TIGR01451 family)
MNVALADTLPAGVVLAGAAACSAGGTSNCGTIDGAAGATSVSLAGARVAPGAGNGLSVIVPVRFAASLATDPLVHVASATDLATGASGSGSDSDARLPQALLSIAISDGRPGYVPGAAATYVISVANAGPTDAASVSVTDLLPAGVTLAGTASCTPTGIASCGSVQGLAGASAAGLVGGAIAAGAGNALTLAVPVRFAAALTVDPLVNGATASAAGAAPVNAADSDVRIAPALVSVSVDDGASSYVPGGSGSYVIRIVNPGPSDLAALDVRDLLPAGVTLAGAVTCTATGNAQCGAIDAPPGGGLVQVGGAALGAGNGNMLAYALPVRFAASLTASALTNVVSVTASGMTATAADTNALEAAPVARAIPVDALPALALLVLALAAMAAVRLRAR